MLAQQNVLSVVECDTVFPMQVCSTELPQDICLLLPVDCPADHPSLNCRHTGIPRPQSCQWYVY